MLYLVMQTSLIILLTAAVFFLVGWLAHRWFGKRKQAAFEEPVEAGVAVYVKETAPPVRAKDETEAKLLRERVALLERKVAEKDKELKALLESNEPDVHIDKLTQLESSVKTQGAILEQKTIALEKMRNQYDAERETSKQYAEKAQQLEVELTDLQAAWTQREAESAQAMPVVDPAVFQSLESETPSSDGAQAWQHAQELEVEVERLKAEAITNLDQLEESRAELLRLNGEWQRYSANQADLQSAYDQERAALEARIDRLSDDLARAQEIRPMPSAPSESPELAEAKKREVVFKRRIAELEAWWQQSSEKAANEVEHKAQIESLQAQLNDAKSLTERTMELEGENDRLRQQNESRSEEWKDRVATLEAEVASERERASELELRMADAQEPPKLKLAKEPTRTADLWAIGASAPVAAEPVREPVRVDENAQALVRSGMEDLRAEIRELRESLRNAEANRAPASTDEASKERNERLERRLEEQERTIERLREERLADARRDRRDSSRESADTNLSEELARHFSRFGDELQRLRHEIPAPTSNPGNGRLEEKIAHLETELVRLRFERTTPAAPAPIPVPVPVAAAVPPSPWENRAIELERELRQTQVARLDRVESEMWRQNQVKADTRDESNSPRAWEAHWFDKMADKMTPAEPVASSSMPATQNLERRIDELEEKLRDGNEDRVRLEENADRDRERLEADWQRRLDDRVAAERAHIETLEDQLRDKERKLAEREAQIDRQLQDRLTTMQEELRRLATAPPPTVALVKSEIGELEEIEARERKLVDRERELEEAHRLRVDGIEAELRAWRERAEATPQSVEQNAPWEAEIRTLHTELAEKERWIAEREMELEKRLQEKLESMEAELLELRTPALEPEVEATIEEEDTLREQVLALQEELRNKENELRTREAELNNTLQSKLSNLEIEIQRMEANVLQASQSNQTPPDSFFHKLEEFLESREKALATLVPTRDTAEEDRLKDRVMLLEAELLDKQRRLEEVSGSGQVDPEAERRLRHSMDDLQKLLQEKERTIEDLSRQIHELSMKLDPNLVGDDNLQQITGIGPFTRKVLREEFGVVSFRQVARLTAEEIQKISERLFFRDRIQRDDWVGQAIMLHFKKYNEKIDLTAPPYPVKWAS